MAQNAQSPAKRAILVAVLALTLPGVAAQACEHRGHHAPLVLNGHLSTSDFTGGVGYGAGDGYYIQTSVYVAGGASAASSAGAFAFAHAHAFAAASAGRGGFGHR